MYAASKAASMLICRRRTSLALSIAAMIFLAAGPLPAQPVSGRSGPLPHLSPESVGMDAARLQFIDGVVAEGLRQEKMPGCVVLVGRKGGIVFLKAYGSRQLQPEPVPMTADTLFDLASLTKPIATATSIMTLVEAGRLRLDDRVSTHIPSFGANGKEALTLLQLLTHQSGLLPDNSIKDYEQGAEQAMQNIYALGLSYEPGTKFVYSDVNFIVLGELVKRITGQNVHEYSQARIFEPLGMTETGFLPPEALQRRAAPTEQRAGQWIRGDVHDPRSYLLGGIAGHAGLFSTAEDLALYAQMMLNGGELDGVRILKPETVTLMTRAVETPGGLRGLGWDMRTGYSSNRGDLFSNSAFGHGGFTGTAIWIDPELEMFVIFLSNRVHPDGKGSVNPLIGRIGTIAGAAVCTPCH